MPNPLARTVPNSRNKLFSTDVIWQDNIFSAPIPPPVIPPSEPTESDCFIDIQEVITLCPGERSIYIFKYFVGNPVKATEFAIFWYASAEDREAHIDPITSTADLPVYNFFPSHPFQDPLNTLKAKVRFTVPETLPYTKLYPEIVLF